MKSGKPLIVEKDGSICTLSINNPSKRNALTPGCLAALVETFESLVDDRETKVVVLRGRGTEAFSSGADITSMSAAGHDTDRQMASDPGAASRAIINYPLPVIAMLHGYTLGAGMLLAVACDIRIASTTVKMGIPTSRMGLLPSHSGFKRFMNVLGYSTALEVFLTGRSYDSRDCLQMGLISHLIEPEEIEGYTYRMAKEIVRCAPLSLRGSKFVLNKLAENTKPSAQDIEIFNRLAREAATSADHEEAKAAFKEKRAPVFKGA